MTADVDWPNGWEGGRVHGRDQVRSYWERQWAELDSYVEPVTVSTEPDGRVAVELIPRRLTGAHHNSDHDRCLGRISRENRG